jgi:hypothetical protein
MDIKIDIDNRNWNSYKRYFTRAIETVMQKHWLCNPIVYKTKRGYHIYINVPDLIDYNECLLIECLLGSDTEKQRYAYLEGNDILFEEKDGYLESIDYKKSKELNKMLKSMML